MQMQEQARVSAKNEKFNEENYTESVIEGVRVRGR